MKENIILIGGGGHCKSVIEVIESTGNFEIKGILDIAEKTGQEILGYHIIGTDEDIAKYAKLNYSFHITIGHIKNNKVRSDIYQRIKATNGKLPVIIASTAFVSAFASINEGSVIMHKVFVNANASIGSNCIINTGSAIEHDTVIEDHCHVSTHAVINGECVIGENTFIGSNSTIIQGIKIAENVIIGAGSVVIKNTEPGFLYAGNPAKLLKRIS